jgi:xanthine dehydrogenase accessory factor
MIADDTTREAAQGALSAGLPPEGHDPFGPFAAVLDRPDAPAALAFVTGTEGPSYRPVGAAMALFADGSRSGSLSSGCIEADLALHAEQALGEGRPLRLRYGRGSPFMDIALPCGGGLDILVLPDPDREPLAALRSALAARRPATLVADAATGALSLRDAGETGWEEEGARFRLRCEPEIRFLVFGKGPEAAGFAALVRAVGFPALLLSPDEETRDQALAAGCPARALPRPGWPEDLACDDRTAVVLFFHDHDWEPPILLGALASPAFFVGAQGSRAASRARALALEAMGVPPGALARLRGPVGLVPSARDARTLAVSVLAEVLATAQPART